MHSLLTAQLPSGPGGAVGWSSGPASPWANAADSDMATTNWNLGDGVALRALSAVLAVT